MTGLTRMVVSFLRWTKMRAFRIFCCLGIMSMTWMLYKLNSDVIDNRQPVKSPKSVVSAHSGIKSQSLVTEFFEKPQTSFPVHNTALLILQSEKSRSTIQVAILHSRFKYKSIKDIGHTKLTKDDGAYGLYSVVIFEDLTTYLTLPQYDRTKIDEYCKKYKVGMVIFTKPQVELDSVFHSFPLTFTYTPSIYQTYIIDDTPLANITRPNVAHNMAAVPEWVTFHPRHDTYRIVSHGIINSENNISASLAIIDVGKFDGIARVFFGQRHGLWIHKILFLDAVALLTHGAMTISKTKLIQIDIDDMFLGSAGTKMKAADALVSCSILFF